MAHRDRHQRGMRGMLAPPRSLAWQQLRDRRPVLASDFFFECVSETIEDIALHCPEALASVDIGAEDVPDVSDQWQRRVPLAIARDATLDRLAQVIVYRRPIELRCTSRRQLRELVFTAIVEQLSIVTGISASQLDPENHRGEDN